MSSTSTISFELGNSDVAAEISVAVWLDDLCVFQTDHLTEQAQIKHDVPDDDGEHTLRIVMLGKTADHTEIDVDGSILKDVLISISNFDIDGIDVNQVFLENSSYTHDFNGTQPEIVDTFHGCMGCNGTVTLKFITPMYLWLLENM